MTWHNSDSPMNNTAKSRPRLLITRPEEQSARFVKLCESEGFRTVLLPCLQILPVILAPNTLATQYQQADHILFTSANAVKFAHAIMPLPWPNSTVHAIGAATARALNDHGQPLFKTPQAPYNSESFIQQICSVEPARLLMIKGVGGRTLIASTLQERGWKIDSADVYRRDLPNIPNAHINELFHMTPPDIVSVSSDQVLSNLWQLCKDHQQELTKLPLVVNSRRCADWALTLGFQNQVLVAEPAGDEGQISILCNWHLTAPKM